MGWLAAGAQVVLALDMVVELAALGPSNEKNKLLLFPSFRLDLTLVSSLISQFT